VQLGTLNSRGHRGERGRDLAPLTGLVGRQEPERLLLRRHRGWDDAASTGALCGGCAPLCLCRRGVVPRTEDWSAYLNLLVAMLSRIESWIVSWLSCYVHRVGAGVALALSGGPPRIAAIGRAARRREWEGVAGRGAEVGRGVLILLCRQCTPYLY
jgi:hypothetical protein